MATTTTSAALVPVGPVFSDQERLAAGFLAGCSGLTREAYAWTCGSSPPGASPTARRCSLSFAREIGCFGRDLEAAGRARTTVTHCPCTIAGFYRYAVEEELLEHSPTVHVRRPPRLRVQATGLDRNEIGLLPAAGLGSAREHALISLPH